MWITFGKKKKMEKLTTEERRRRRFSESFRKEQVALIESGEKTVSQVSQQSQAKPDSVKRWLDKYGKKERPKPILIQTMEDVNRIKALERENAHLKQVIGQQQVELLYQKECLALAKERLGAEFEKKTKCRW